VDTAFVAFLTAFGKVDTAIGAWHGGHSLWTSAVEQRTQPCGALRKWTSPVTSGPGEDQVPYNSAAFTDFDSLAAGNLYLKTRVPSNWRTLSRLK